jgi:hypothetical protein
VGQIRTAAAGTSLDNMGTKMTRKIKRTVLTFILGFRLFHHLEGVIEEGGIRADHMHFNLSGKEVALQTQGTEFDAPRRCLGH